MSAEKPKTPSELEKAIAQIHARMTALEPDTKEYAAAADQLVKLEALRTEKHSWRPSTDTLITVGGNIVVALLIVAYEERNALTSKAIGFIQKPFR